MLWTSPGRLTFLKCLSYNKRYYDVSKDRIIPKLSDSFKKKSILLIISRCYRFNSLTHWVKVSNRNYSLFSMAYD
ncbi:hypothetical protein MBAV_004686 [Candidatus Magnetobacterium bavaricum]|uniref:Uncharacterized protein n=1 Tax=Candidatus Magnetobacterium bavaricum TaxID=29290 RepID=A0A0F3GMG8_9BACT|nr:hypothetical protein MBAV_004686 [Candidatus Magnetobacterium bavaricum]